MSGINRMDIEEILELLPHRYPFLLIDRVLDIETHEDGTMSLTALKNITYNEPFFTGHFPIKPVFPGVLILEAMAQATGVLAFKMISKVQEGELYYFASVDNAKFKKPVVPGDSLILKVLYIKERRGVAKFEGQAFVDGQLVCSAELMCARRSV